MTMRLLMVGPSGVIAMRRPIAWALAAGHEVWLVDNANRYARERPPNLHFVPLLARGATRLQRLLRTPRAADAVAWLGALQLRALVTALRPDVIHVHKIDFRALCCARARVRPLVVSAWGTLNQLLMPAVPFLDLALARTVLERTDALIVESPHLVPASQALIKRPLRVELIPLGTDTSRFQPGRSPQAEAWRQQLGIPDDTLVLLSPRGWQELYNHHLILEAYALARPRLHKATRLAFLTLGLGHYDAAERYYQQVRARADALGISEAIHWLRPVPFEQMPTLYSLADIVINYPSTDAFPSTLIEAAAAERPTLTSWLPTYAGTFIEQHLTTVPPDQPPALADALVALVNSDPATHAPRLAAARLAVQSEYEEAVAVRRMMALYEGTGGRQRGRGGEGERGRNGGIS